MPEKIPSENKNIYALTPDPDANGLYNKDGNAFTDELIEFFENQQKRSAKDREEKKNDQSLLPKKRENFKKGWGI